MSKQQEERALSDKIRRARLLKGLTTTQAAKILNVSAVTISVWERGANRPYPKHWQAICDLLGLQIEDLLPPDRGPAPRKGAR